LAVGKATKAESQKCPLGKSKNINLPQIDKTKAHPMALLNK